MLKWRQPRGFINLDYPRFWKRVVVGTRINSKGATVIYRRDMGLGGYPEISLAEARDIARERRKQIRKRHRPA